MPTRPPRTSRPGTRPLRIALLAGAIVLLSAPVHGQELPDDPDELRAEIARASAAADTLRLGELHNRLGLVHWGASRYDSALVHFLEARSIWTERQDAQSLGRVFNNIGVTYYQWGDYEPALEAYLRSLALRRQSGDRRGAALVLTNVGRTFLDWGQVERALVALQEALGEAEAVGDSPLLGYVLHNLGTLHLETGSYAEARHAFERSLAAYDPSIPGVSAEDAQSGRSLNLLGLGLLHVREGDPTGARALVDEVLERAAASGHPRSEILARIRIGQALRAEGDLTGASANLERALATAHATGHRPLALNALAELAEVYESRGDAARALANLRAHDALRDSVFDQQAALRVHAMEDRIAFEQQERENLLLREEHRESEAVIARQRFGFVVGGTLLLASGVLVAVLLHYNRSAAARERLLASTNEALERANRDLRGALSEVRTLKGLVPICVHCKKVRDDEGFWEGVETYVSSRSEALFSHSICADCGPEAYGADWPEPDEVDEAETPRV